MTCGSTAPRSRPGRASWRSTSSGSTSIEPGPAPALDPERHYLEGSVADVAAYLLTLDAINFGSGWFPTLRKRPGCSGYFTIAWALADRLRADGPWSQRELRAMGPAAVAHVLGQDPDHELMALYARALRQLGALLGERSAMRGDRGRRRLGRAAGRAARGRDGDVRRRRLLQARPDHAERPRAGRRRPTFDDLDRLTIFADNLVPHVLRVDGVLRYDAGAGRAHRRGASCWRAGSRGGARSAPAPFTPAS